ncbi:MAG: hypothetical protein IJE09_03945 [Oscillospiraceae bacterium]|nr:hypothetical protein [Oscillospiraceae bacterium]
MKKTLQWLLKAFVAGCIALVLLCAFCMLYYNVPVHHNNPSGATDYVWESHKFYSRGIDGFALGRTNNEGHNNLSDYHEGDAIDILLMGSSNMEGFNVAQDKSTAAVINQLFEGEKFCYNIGTAGHTMLNNVKNLNDALDKYQPEEYVIIECISMDYDYEAVQAVVKGTFPDNASHSGGIIGLLQRLPYLRLFYTQFFKDGALAFGAGKDEPAAPAPAVEREYSEIVSPLLDMVAESCENHAVQPIIVYNNTLMLREDGSLYSSTDTDKLAAFSQLCEERGICFVNVIPSFIESYEQSHKLPYGFSNTSPGGGHMNAHGHSIFAAEVCAAIREMEA